MLRASALAHLVRHEEARLTGTACPTCGRRPLGVTPGGNADAQAGYEAPGGQGGKRQRRKRARQRNPRQIGPAPGATPPGAGGGVLPGWQGWSQPVSLSTLLRLGQRIADARRRRQPTTFVPKSLRPYFQDGHALYRISTPGSAPPLTIGQVTASGNVGQRVRQHAGALAGGDPSVVATLRKADPRKVTVQLGRVARSDLDERLMHAYEIWLQNREHIRLYQPNTRTFDEFDLGYVEPWSHAA